MNEDNFQPVSAGDEEPETSLSQISTALMAAKILERSRAEGVPLNELSLDIQGGRIRAVTQKEKRATDEIRRKELIERMRQRSIRGDHSLAEDISVRLRRCMSWIDYLSRFSSVTEKDLVSIRRNLESMNNRAASLVKEVSVLEMAIERKKQEDPIICQVESASTELMEAIRDKDFQRVVDLRAFCESNIPAYNMRKKRLKPYLAQARQARLKFLAEKRQVMRMQFETGGQVVELLASDLSNGRFSKFNSDSLNSITVLIHESREIRSLARPIIDKLGQPLGNVALSFLGDLEKDLSEIDERLLAPFEGKVEELMNSVGNALRQMREALSQEVSEEKSAKRMAFQQKQEK